PVLDDLGLLAAISYVVSQARETSAEMEIVATLTPDDPFAARPPADVELAVFRIVQEAVDNAVRHSSGSLVSVNAVVEPGFVEVTIQDDGVGIPVQARRRAIEAGHVGLATMAERAALIGAQLDIRSVEPSGTAIRVKWHAAP